MIEHYTDGRRYSHIWNAWIDEKTWNDKEEIAYLKHALAEKDAELNKLRTEFLNKYGDLLTLQQWTKQREDLKEKLDQQARELERVAHDLDFTNKCTIPDLESQLEQAFKTAVQFGEWYLQNKIEAREQAVKAFLATPAATALQQAKDSQ